MNQRGVFASVLAVLMVLMVPWNARAEGALKARTESGEDRGNFPLVRTDVHVGVSGQVTEVSVHQVFHNPYNERIEAVYVFPLPDDAAVDALSMRLGARTVQAEIARRGEARTRYDTARSTGHRAALLEQERPNIFTLSVANIDPGTDVEVHLRYVALATYSHGTYALVFPMVVGPRYVPGDPLPTLPTGTGPTADTTRVPDASRISLPYAPPGMRAGHAITVAAHVEAGTEIATVDCPDHDVVIQRPMNGIADIALRDKDEIPNRDFILRWTLAAPTLQAAVLTHRDPGAGDGTVAVMLEPRHDPPPTEIAARELVFLLDTSGSMQGPPMETVRAAVRRALTTLAPQDSFNVIDFADTASAFSPTPLVATPENVQRGLTYLDHLEASGGTNQLAGIHAALSMPGDPMRMRYVVFLTDGYIGNEAEVIALTHREVGNARIFAVGVGSSVNRYLLDEVSAVGRGEAEYLRPGEDPSALVERFQTRIGQPWLTDITLDWGGLAVDAVEPAVLPDLSALSPLVVMARYSRPGTGVLTLRGRVGGRAYVQTLPVTLPETQAGHDGLGMMWARARITTLSRQEHGAGGGADLAEAITGLALAHHLMSQYTSLVAVDTEGGDPTHGAPRQVVQPADAPAGVNVSSAGGNFVGTTGGVAASGMGWGGGGRGEGISLGSVGTLGHGAVGYGMGAGRGVGNRGGGVGYGGRAVGYSTVGYGGLRTGSVVPRVHGEAPTVQGALATEVIRRVVTAHLGEITACYSLGLRQDPGLAGRVVVRWVVGPDGRVMAAVMQSSELAAAAVNGCLVHAVRGWIFPSPGSGPVTITYPFVLGAPGTPGTPVHGGPAAGSRTGASPGSP